MFKLWCERGISLQNRRIGEASAIHERAREARGQVWPFARARVSLWPR